MSQLPAQPLSYHAPPPAPPATRRGWGKWLAWTLFVVVALLLFMLLSKQDSAYTKIPFSEFAEHLQKGRVSWVIIEAQEATGQFNSPQTVAGRQRLHFLTELPDSAVHDWAFAEWLMKNSGGAEIRYRSTHSLFINILLPLIPWLLIFAFVWFVVFRALRKAQEARQNQVVITGPGRWVPDEPQKPGAA